MIKLLHAAAALLTVALYLLRRRCLEPPHALCTTKRGCLKPSASPSCLCSYEYSDTSVPLPVEDYMCCPRGATNASRMPKYKRDPDILVDNENIGVHPHG